MGRWRRGQPLEGVPVTAPDHGSCPHCPTPRGVHAPECPNYYRGNSLTGVPSVPQPGPVQPPDSTEPGEPEGS